MMHGGLRLAAVFGLALLGCSTSWSANYYVDFDAGKDSNAGTTAGTAFKHAPGDAQATDAAKAVQLAPGDTVLLKGGVVYYGAITLKQSGTQDQPITIDGNSAGTYGTGKAIIDGSSPLSAWKRAASPEDAKGNTHWKDIFYCDIPKPGDWLNMNLCDTEKPLPVSQMPKPTDPFFQENSKDYYTVPKTQIGSTFPGRIDFEPGTVGNAAAPLSGLLLEQGAVVQPMAGGAFSITMENPMTIASVGIQSKPGYAPVKEVEILGDGKELMKVTLPKEEKTAKIALRKYDLPAPETVKKLTFKLLSSYDGVKENWTKISGVAAYDAAGKNLLQAGGPVLTTIQDDKVLTQTDPHYYDGAWVGMLGGNNFVFFKQVQRFEPEVHKLYIDNYTESLYKITPYCLYNSVRLIDRPGEFSIEATADPKIWRVYFLPEKLEAGAPSGISYAKRDRGIALIGASHVMVKGLLVRRQGTNARADGLDVMGGSDITVTGCEFTLINGVAGVSGSDADHIVVEKCFIHDCPGHSKGMVLYKCTNLSTRFCRFVRNSATGVDYYTCSHGDCRDNIVLDHRGMHCNGLTFYATNKDLIIERNEIHDSNIAFTIRDAEDVIIRNNIMDGSGKAAALGIWPEEYNKIGMKNVQFLNNIIIGSDPKVDWSAGAFTNNKTWVNTVFRNNIIDGLAGTMTGVTFDHNLYTRWGDFQKDHKLGAGELFEADLKKIFVDPDHNNFHLCAGSPAIGAGVDVSLKEDMAGVKIPAGTAPNIGVYASKP